MAKGDAQLGERHETLYFVDGNIVLLAPRTNSDEPALLFRVHKSVLSRHSPIFSDMFDIGNSSGTSNRRDDDSYDGVPLVHLPDDADHLAIVLKILYYQSTLPWTPYDPHYPATITPILDLSVKYEIGRMREQIKTQLESDWPQTLKDWDKLEREIQFMVDDSNSQRIDDHFPEPVSAIKLARKFDIPSILPAAFYHLSRLSILDDWEKTHADSSIRIQNLTKRTARWELLSADDFRCLLLGKAEIAELLRGCKRTGELSHATTDMFWTTDARTTNEEQWRSICDRCSQSADPLAMLQMEGHNKYVSGTKNRPSAARKLIWKRLGKLFHLEDD